MTGPSSYHFVTVHANDEVLCYSHCHWWFENCCRFRFFFRLFAEIRLTDIVQASEYVYENFSIYILVTCDFASDTAALESNITSLRASLVADRQLITDESSWYWLL